MMRNDRRAQRAACRAITKRATHEHPTHGTVHLARTGLGWQVEGPMVLLRGPLAAVGTHATVEALRTAIDAA